MQTTDRPKLLYPSMVIAAIAVTVFSLLGIATLTGALPVAHPGMQSGYGIDEAVDAMPETPVAGGASSRAAPTARATKATPAGCASCGVVESVRAIEVKGEGSGLGAVAGGITGALLGSHIGGGSGRTIATVAGAAGGAYAGNEIEKNTKKRTSYRIRVRMADGEIRTFTQGTAPGVGSGDKVRIVDGMVVLQS